MSKIFLLIYSHGNCVFIGQLKPQITKIRRKNSAILQNHWKPPTFAFSFFSRKSIVMVIFLTEVTQQLDVGVDIQRTKVCYITCREFVHFQHTLLKML